MNLVVKPVFTNPFRIIPVSAVIRYTVGTVTPTIWFPLKVMVIVRGIVKAVFNTTVLKTGGGVKELLKTVGVVEFNPVGVFLDIRKDFITDVVTVSFSENKIRREGNTYQQNKQNDRRKENGDQCLGIILAFLHNIHHRSVFHIVPFLYSASQYDTPIMC